MFSKHYSQEIKFLFIEFHCSLSVVDCPSKEYVTSLVNNEEMKNYQKFAKNDDEVAFLVVHFTPKEIMEDPR